MFKMASMCSQLRFRKKSKDTLKSSGRTKSDQEDKDSTESVSSQCCEEQLVEESIHELCESANSDTEEFTQAEDQDARPRKYESGQKEHQETVSVSGEKNWDDTDEEKDKCNDLTSMEISS